MITKLLEIRDEGTCISALAIKMSSRNPIEVTYLWREGYPRDGHGVVLMKLSNQKATSDPYEWPDLGGGRRTMPVAHLHIIEHFDELKDGDVVDVRVVLGEAGTAVAAEIWKTGEASAA